MFSAIVSEEDLLKAWVATLQQRLGADLLAVALFGSRARGDATPSSDWDLLVLLHSETNDELDRARCLSRACAESTRHTPSILSFSRPSFETRFPPIYLDIAQDARALAGSEYLEPKLERIRQIARDAGLSRQRTHSGLHWQWRTPPHGHWSLDWNGYRDVA